MFITKVVRLAMKVKMVKKIWKISKKIGSKWSKMK